MQKKISIVIPAKNEEQSLSKLLKKFKKYKNFYQEIILVDGKSSDRTIEVAMRNKCKVIKQKKNGYGDAIILGVNNVKTKYFVIYDADGSKDPQYLIQFNKNLKNKKKKDIVFAERYGKGAGSHDDTILTYIGNRIFTYLGIIFFNLKLNDILHTFFLCEVKKFKKLKFKYKDFAFCAEFPIIANRNKLSFSTMATVEKKRYNGVPKVRSFLDGVKILNAMIYLFFNK